MMLKGFLLLALLSLLGAGLYAVYSMGYDAREVIALKDERAAQKRLDDLEHNWRKVYDQALKNAAKREAQIRNDAHDAHASADSLRDQLAHTAIEFANYTPSSLADAATTYGNLLATCSQRYTDLAEVADRHASDLKTMIDAWPK